MFRFENVWLNSNAKISNVAYSSDLLPKDVLHIKGDSGSGKTTLLKSIAKLRDFCGGNIFLHDKNSDEFIPSDWRKSVHYVSQQPIFIQGSVYDNLLMPYTLKSNKNLNIISEVEILHIFERLLLPKNYLQKNAKQLSLGEALRINLIRSIIFSPKVILLDEPIASLDEKARIQVLDFLADWIKDEENQKCIIIVSHDMPLSKFKITKSLTMQSIEYSEAK